MKINCPKCGIVEVSDDFPLYSSCLVMYCECTRCPNWKDCGVTYDANLVKEEDK